jgi:hypothetical protein
MANPEALRVNPKNYNQDALTVDQGTLLFRKRIYFTDFSAAATTVNLDTQAGQVWATSFPAGLEIMGAYFSVVTNFTGGAVATATLAAGTTGSPGAYVAATSVFSGSPKINVGLTQVPGTFLSGAATYPFVGNATVRIQLVTTGANASALTAGKADFYMRLQAASVRNV